MGEIMKGFVIGVGVVAAGVCFSSVISSIDVNFLRKDENKHSTNDSNHEK